MTALAALGAAGSVWALWPVDPRLRVRQAARSQLGRTNSAPYWADVLPGQPSSGWPRDWCGAFALWALHQAGLAKDVSWIIGKGFLFLLPRTQNPQVGDIAYFDTNQHHAVVVGVGPNSVDLVNGNGTGGAVSPSTVPRSHVTGYYNIEPFLSAAPASGTLVWIAASALVLGAGAWVLLPARGSRN